MAKRVERAIAGKRVHGEIDKDAGGVFARVYALVRSIPRGRVMTYGQIATCLGNRLSPRAVGWAMHGCPKGVPWQRVVNARGACSTDRLPDMPAGIQRALLERERIKFRDNGTLDLSVYLWSPASGGQSVTTRRSGTTRRKRSTTSE
ncbi:MAG: MGMT family protein [Acidobacteriota bacterium]